MKPPMHVNRTNTPYRVAIRLLHLQAWLPEARDFPSRLAQFVLGARQSSVSAFAPQQQPLRLFKYSKIDFRIESTSEKLYAQF
jgi:hypothetical protein